MKKHFKYLVFICQVMCLMPGDVSGSFLLSWFESTQERLQRVSKSLLSAAERGDITEATKALDLFKSQGENINQIKDEDGNTALHMAAYKGHKDIVRLLLNSKANIETQNRDGETALHEGAYGGRRDMVWLLLDCKVNIEARTKEDGTALHMAAYKGHEDVVRLLFDRGVNIKARDICGHTALHVAAYKGRRDVVRLLLDCKANIEVQNESGDTALHMAAYKGRRDVVRLLLDCKANIEAQDKHGETAFDDLAFGDGCYGGILKLLVNPKANIDAQNEIGQTALYLMVNKGNKDMVQLLLDYRANIEAQAKNNETPLHIAILYDNNDVLLLLMGCYDLYDGKQLQNLYNHWEKNNASKFISRVNESVSNAKVRFQEADIPLRFVLPKDVCSIIALFMGYDPYENSYFPLPLKLSEEVVFSDCIFNRNIAIQQRDEGGNTPLHSAALHGWKDVVAWLIAGKANPNIQNKRGRTALLEAVSGRHIDVVRQLLEARADVHHKDYKMNDALTIARGLQHQEMITLLEKAE